MFSYIVVVLLEFVFLRPKYYKKEYFLMAHITLSMCSPVVTIALHTGTAIIDNEE